MLKNLKKMSILKKSSIMLKYRVMSNRHLNIYLSGRPFSTVNSENKNILPDINPEKNSEKGFVLKEKISGQPTINDFKSETAEILKIVSRSIYTNQEIFVRELISNALDATEQMRYHSLQKASLADISPKLEIYVHTDKDKNLLVLEDNGVGMTRTELISNLGTIAKSGSRSFIDKVKASEGAASSIIGQFGVGFYSAFMVSEKVEVFTKSALSENSESLYWVSDGKGKFSIYNAENVSPGTKIVVHLDKKYKNFSESDYVKRIILRYSQYANFPIFLDGEKLTMPKPIWLSDPSKISREQYAEFYKKLTNAYDEPIMHFHFHKDYPLSLSALFFVPKFHSEKYGNARMKPGVSLHCRKVLIQKESKDILPDWMRFIKGIVDSENLNLNINRETTQSEKTLQRIKLALTKKFISDLKTLAKKDRAFYSKFYAEYNLFLKEGVCTDENVKDQLAPLLRFDSSKGPDTGGAEAGAKEGNGCHRSLEDYIGSMKPDQTAIYYLVTTNRNAALHSPYFESFAASGTEVLFLYTPIDEFVMQAIAEFNKRPIVSIESEGVKEKDINTFDSKVGEFQLKSNQSDDLCEWLQKSLGKRVKSVKTTSRLNSSPALISGHENSSVQIMMQLASGGSNSSFSSAPQKLEINPAHPVVRGLFYTMSEDEKLATKVAEQLFENALIDAGLLKDPRGMLGRMNELMATAMDVDGIEAELREKAADLKTKAAFKASSTEVSEEDNEKALADSTKDRT